MPDEKDDVKVLSKEEGSQTSIDNSKEADELLEIKIKDQESKITQRPIIAKWIFVIVIIQNIAVFSALFVVIFLNQLDKYDLAMTGLIGGTLGESFFLVKFIVQFTFSDINGISKLDKK
jgi:hypothetical protein